MSRRQYTFFCPTGTLFNQALMTCDFWFNVNCQDSPRFYSVNVDVFNSFQPPQRSTTPPPQPPPRPRPSPRVVMRVLPPSSFNNTTVAARPTARSTTPRRSQQPVYVPRTTSTTPRSRTSFDDDGPEWVYAWLKENHNATRRKQMALQDLPLIAPAPKTETAFDFLMNNEENAKTARSSFDFKINHQRQNDNFSRAFDAPQPKFVARAHNELVAETGNHPSPWQFPLNPKVSQNTTTTSTTAKPTATPSASPAPKLSREPVKP